MSDSDEPREVDLPTLECGPAVDIAAKAILNELAERIGPMSERDALAYTVAVSKALSAGVRVGVGNLITAIEAANAGLVLRLQADLTDDTDSWADQYGR